MKLDFVTSVMICKKYTNIKGAQVKNRPSYQVKSEIVDLRKLKKRVVLEL